MHWYFIIFTFLCVNNRFYAQENLEQKISRAYDLLDSAKIDEAYILAKEINLEFEKDTVGLFTYKQNIYFLNVFIHKEQKQYSEAIKHLKKLIPLSKDEVLLFVYRTLTFLNLDNANYKSALEYAILNVEKEKELKGEEHPDYLSSLSLLPVIYSDLGDYIKSKELNLEILKKIEKEEGKENQSYTTRLGLLAEDYRNLGQLEKALETSLLNVEIRKKLYGVNHESYLLSVNNLANIYFDLKDLNKALEIDIELVEIYKKRFGDKSEQYLTSLSNLSLVYSEMGEYTKAHNINLEVTENLKTILGEDNLSFINSLGNLAVSFSKLDKHQEALKTNIIVTEKYEKLLGIEHPVYLNSLFNLAQDYTELAQFDKALEISLHVAKKLKKLLGDNHPDYLYTLNNLATIYDDLGQFDKAIDIALQVTEKRKTIFGENNLDYIFSLGNLGQFYSKSGQYDKALEILLLVIDKQKILLGDNHPILFTTMSNTALVYSALAQFDKSLEINSLVMEGRKKVLGENSQDYLISLLNISLDFVRSKNFKKALEYNLIATKGILTTLGGEHPTYLHCLNQQAVIFSNLGETEKSIEIDKIVLELRKKHLGADHPDYLTSVNNLAMTYYSLMQFDKSLELLHDLPRKMESSVDKFNANYLQMNENLAIVNDGLDEINASCAIYKENSFNILQLIKNNFTILTEIEKEKYSNKYSSSFRAFQSFSHRNFTALPSLANDNYNLALSTKGQVLESSINVRKSIADTQDTSLQKTYDQWVIYKKMIEKQSLLPITERPNSYDQNIEKANDLERKLVKVSSYLQDQKKMAEITLKDVQHHLKENEVALEFVSFNYFDKKRWTDSVYYAALLLNKSDSTVKYIPLFEEKQLNNLLTKKSSRESSNINTLYKNPKLYDLLWEPLALHIPKNSTVYYSPSGVLHQIHLASIIESDSTFLADSYQFVPLSTTSKIALPKEDIDATSIAIFGGLHYDNDQNNNTKSDSTAFYLTNDIANRSYFTSDSSRGGKWTYLSATLEEANNIIKIANQKKLDVKPYLGCSGIEENFKSLGFQKSPSIVHIASHGFFFPDPKKDLKKMNAQLYGDNQFVASDLTLNRSGLLFSGANKAWAEGSKVVPNGEDGILTALEVGSTALFNTNLVVLSACETGLGDIKGSEGVYGLQRAFKMAGVRYLMMSLWKVPDNATQEFMTTFYTELLANKKSIRDAFNTTQKLMRDKYRNEPYKWAGFVLME